MKHQAGSLSSPPTSAHPPEPRSAFTIVELLAVIAVIAILAAILFPALGSAQDRAKDAKCQSNLKSWGQGLLLYLGDHNGVFPQEGIEGGAGADPKKPTAWYNVIPEAMGMRTLSNMCYGTPREIPRPPSDKSIFTCPAYKVADIPATVPVGIPLYSYAYNLWIDHSRRAQENPGGTTGLSSNLVISQIVKPAKFVVWGESSGASFDNMTSYHMVYRHRGTNYCNITFADGHVQEFFWTNVFNKTGGKAYNQGVIWDPEGTPNQYDPIW